ncbi:MAG: hypothetical protein IIC78_14145 [Chloroflexi bacterium]|nr:hypothetical protein [Chloroflexota bacterium]
MDSRVRTSDITLAIISTEAKVGADQSDYQAIITEERKLPEEHQSPWLAIHGWVSKEAQRP